TLARPHHDVDVISECLLRPLRSVLVHAREIRGVRWRDVRSSLRRAILICATAVTGRDLVVVSGFGATGIAGINRIDGAAVIAAGLDLGRRLGHGAVPTAPAGCEPDGESGSGRGGQESSGHTG